LRVSTLSAIVCSSVFLAVGAPSALAASTGGAPAESPAAPTAAPAPTAPAVHLDPVTARSRSVAYKGPVYEKTATGEVVPYQPLAPATTTGAAGGATGGSPVGSPVGVTADTKPDLLVPGTLARYVNGLAAAPMSVPESVQQIIWTANQIIGLPYIYGGGHASFTSPGYDCSGTVSFALHGASLLTTPMDSSEFMAWGSHGPGRYITIFANGGHAYMTVAGLRLDTSAADDPTDQQGPRWRPLRPANEGFTVRHPLGF
jgi:cell wall-associated NlpC family hydrolase